VVPRSAATASGATCRAARFGEGQRLPRSVLEFGKEREQIPTQPTIIAVGDPNRACPIERLKDGIRGRNYL
jgi:hypothetical protein